MLQHHYDGEHTLSLWSSHWVHGPCSQLVPAPFCCVVAACVSTVVRAATAACWPVSSTQFAHSGAPLEPGCVVRRGCARPLVQHTVLLTWWCWGPGVAAGGSLSGGVGARGSCLPQVACARTARCACASAGAPCGAQRHQAGGGRGPAVPGSTHSLGTNTGAGHTPGSRHSSHHLVARAPTRLLLLRHHHRPDQRCVWCRARVCCSDV